MQQLSRKDTTLNALTSNNDERPVQTLNICPCHIARKLFLLMQRQITVMRSIAVLITICVVLLTLADSEEEASRSQMRVSIAQDWRSPRYTFATARTTPRLNVSRDQMESVRRELNARRQRVKRVCDRMDPARSHLDIAITNLIVDVKHNVSWCPIYKAASSTWMNYFAALRGALTDATLDFVRRNRMQMSDIVRQRFKHGPDLNKTYEVVARTKNFLIVRHPLERLLSAYRDKLEHMDGREYYYKRFGRRIVRKYRRSGNETKLEPTFEEFLRFIIEERYFDEHWAPYYRTCRPCVVRYDYILKFETLNRDQDFFIRDANLSDYLYEIVYPQNINPNGTTTKEVLNTYVKEIPRSVLHEIYKIYEDDCKLFDYTFTI